MLDILADYLSMKNLKFARLDGRMNLEERAVDMDKFRNDPDMAVFLVSTRAGGLGVNLTAADTVIIYDSDWASASQSVYLNHPLLTLSFIWLFSIEPPM